PLLAHLSMSAEPPAASSQRADSTPATSTPSPTPATPTLHTPDQPHAESPTSPRLPSIGGFFFTSRRPHTRPKRDWSSDVCSSDLLRDGCDVRAQHGPRTVLGADVAPVAQLLQDPDYLRTATGIPSRGDHALFALTSTVARTAEGA